MTFPQGPKGDDGLSAYEIWVDEVKNGNIVWDVNYIDKDNFFLYLKGKDGADGQNGQNGVDGKSAYQLWVEEVNKGLDNPHNPGTNWSTAKVSMQDFWYYLTGAKGQNGSTPTIGSNGNWYIDGNDTGIPAKGKDGQNGQDGSTPTIGDNGNWFINGNDTGIPAKGQNGSNGQDGSTPTIGSNGNWHINGIDTGVPAKGQNGQNGQDGSTPTIGDNGNWFINGIDTGVKAFGKDGQNGSNGQDGSTPTIGSNGNWYINGVDTGVPAKGQNGQNGSNGQDGSTPTIGTNGNWFINGNDTGIPATGSNGQDGANGQNGKSAYELWVEEVAKGLDNPHIPGTQWPKDQTTTQHFWEYLRGADGKDGQDGQDGTPGESGKPGQDVIIVKGKPNVVAQYSQQEVSEYVKTTDGSVSYIVYDDQGSVAPGAVVSGIPGIDPSLTFTADANGQFTITKDQLPIDLPTTDRFGTCQVNYLKSTGSQVAETSAPNTYVPNKMQIRIRIDSNQGVYLEGSNIEYLVYVERKTDPDKDWEIIPTYLGELTQQFKQHELVDMNDPSSYKSGYRWYFNRDISQPVNFIGQPRMVKENLYIQDTYTWDNQDHYFTLVLHSYYGETPHLNAVIKMAPIQYMPLLTNLKAYNYSSTPNVFSEIEGDFDFSATNIDENLIFKSDLKKETRTATDGKSFDYYYPEKDIIANTSMSQDFYISFSVIGNTSDNANSLASITAPSFKASVPYLNSSVRLESRNYNYNFKTIGNIGTLQFGGEQTDLKIIGSNNFPDIPVTLK